ncbi:MAG: indole-3-glycerol phosphate synthase TrpC [Proteobacteria bacterium]|nr:indole-3-glycerol phosphate synthase TrpC [Pseudomonadota bacterium]
MTDILTEICARTLADLAPKMIALPLAEVEARAKTVAPVRGFAAGLRAAHAAGGYGLIAEIKKASPSKGLIREDFDPATLARAYEQGGASCLSVLTDEPYFQGADRFLGQARDACALPAIRKDFMVDPYQIPESKMLGADCVLLIMAALEDRLAAELREAARAWNLDVLAEVHSEAELDRALALNPEMVGINNRDLKTFNVDLGMTERLAPQIPDGILVVSESGLSGPDDLARMAACGVRSFLIGESLMRQADVAEATRNLLAGGFPRQAATA